MSKTKTKSLKTNPKLNSPLRSCTANSDNSRNQSEFKAMKVVITTRGKTHENTEGPWYDHVSFEGESSPTGSLSKGVDCATHINRM